MNTVNCLANFERYLRCCAVGEAGEMQLQDTVCNTILAIDKELSTAKDPEYRKVLVKAAYILRDLSLRMQLQKSPEAPAGKVGSPVG
jgi:hypothetical protein